MFEGETDAELAETLRSVSEELSRRAALAQIPVQQDELNARFLTASGVTPGEGWRAPSTAIEAYPTGWQVTHGGRSWVSTVAGNVSEPGGSGWEEREA